MSGRRRALPPRIPLHDARGSERFRELESTACAAAPSLDAEWMANVGTPGVGLYPATKAALVHLTRAWAAEFGPSGVRVNAVAPGATVTPGNEASLAILEAMTADAPAGVPGRPIDIAHAVRFLASDEAAYVHGAVIDVDGGIVAARVK